MTALNLQDHLAERSVVVSEVNEGEFWKPCPGTTKGYLCCGYQILTPLTGCGMYCAYCILQTYFDHSHQTVYTNLDDLAEEVRTKMANHNGVVRFGTGEFGDSLFQENNYGLSKKVAAVLEPFPRTLIEFKTKSTNIESLHRIRHPERVVIGFSMNTPRMIGQFEQNTASLEKRLEAARQCEEMGFWVAFHFDPMIWYEEWEEEYRAVVKAIFSSVNNPQKIAWCSLGAFRTLPSLRSHLRECKDYLSLFSGEMILGEDRKLRYFRPVRVDFYSTMREEFEKNDPGCILYLCMESPEIWKESGMIQRIPHGLVRYLDNRAEEMLGNLC